MKKGVTGAVHPGRVIIEQPEVGLTLDEITKWMLVLQQNYYCTRARS